MPLAVRLQAAVELRDQLAREGIRGLAVALEAEEAARQPRPDAVFWVPEQAAARVLDHLPLS